MDTDLITGQPQPDSDDEYVRQAVEAKLLELGYAREQIAVDAARRVPHRGESLVINADLLVSVGGRPALVVRCARGSLVSREREVVAAARLVREPWVPLAAAANGDEAELLDTATGRVLAEGPDALPGPDELTRLLDERPPHTATPAEADKAARVWHTFSFIQCPGQCTV